MRISGLKLLVLLFLCMPTMAAAEGSQKILVLGDSLSAGYGLELGESWVDLLQNRLNDQGYEFTLINASISGDTSSGGLARLPQALKRHQPALVIVELGGNDGLRGFPLKVLRRNLDAIITQARAAGAQVALLGMRIPENYGVRYSDGFYRSYGELAEEHQLAFVDFFMEGVALDRGLMQADGIHPNAEAQARLLENAWPAICASLAEISCER